MQAKKHLYLALVLGLSLRAVLFFLIYPDKNILLNDDQSLYVGLSEYLAAHWDFGAGFGPERVPLYPLFMAVCRMFSKSLFFALAVQNVIGLAAIYAIYKTGRLFSPKTASLAAIFAAIDLNLAVSCNQLLTEAVFCPLFCLCLYFLFKYAKEKRAKDLAWGAVLLGLCTLVRPVTMYFPVFMLAWLVFQKGWSVKVKHAAMFATLFALAVSPWHIRNYIVYGHAALTSQGGGHIPGWIVPAVAQYEEGLDLQAATDKYSRMWEEKSQALPEDVKNDPFALDEEAKRFGTEYLLNASPLSIAKAWFWGAMKNVFAPVTIELAYFLKMDWTHFYETPGKSFPEQGYNFIFHNKNKVYSLMLALGIGAVLVFRAIQLMGARKLFLLDKNSLALSCVIIGYFLLVSGPVGYAKYRLPFEPILVLLTALAVSGFSLRTRKTQGENP